MTHREARRVTRGRDEAHHGGTPTRTWGAQGRGAEVQGKGVGETEYILILIDYTATLL